jgi:hypothetical protein
MPSKGQSCVVPGSRRTLSHQHSIDLMNFVRISTGFESFVLNIVPSCFISMLTSSHSHIPSTSFPSTPPYAATHHQDRGLVVIFLCSSLPPPLFPLLLLFSHKYEYA